MSVASAPRTTPLRLLLAWGVHAFTASGAVVALAALLLTAEGAFAKAALLMLVGLAIDSVDGGLARAARVAEVVPRVDGRRLDDIVDYLNYVIVPAVFMVATGGLPHWSLAAVPILASAYGFSQCEAKTDDHFFLGFPSYWNVVAIYLWALGVTPALGSLVVVGLAAAVFVPIRYVYPSHTRVLRRTTNAAALVWILVLAAAIAFPEALGELPLFEISLLFPAYYLALSFWLDGRSRRGPSAADGR